MTPRASLSLGLVWVVLALLLTGSGCGGDPYKTAPVSGRVTLDGHPLANATLQFVPESPKGKEPFPSSIGTTGEDGRYSLVLQSGKKTEGAVVGKHKVFILLGAQGGPTDAPTGTGAEPKRTLQKQLPEQYNRKSTLVCDVPAEGREDANFDLKSK
jgi:hypothetical protein